MTDTTWDSEVLGSAWPQHMNKPMAERAFENIRMVGMPEWSEEDLQLARALQEEIGTEVKGLEAKLPDELPGDSPLSENTGGGSDDIGDISWQLPTITLRYPANIPNLPGHNWANSVSMATPIAHKGIVAGAKAQVLNLFDMMTDEELLTSAWDYFDNVQTKDMKYQPLLREQDEPAIHLNREILDEYRSAMEEYYYNPEKYDTYLEQLGIEYPQIR